MKSTTMEFWKLISAWCNQLSKGSNALIVNSALKGQYVARCDIAYKSCMEHNMKNGVHNLDRHKIAAILVIEALELDVIQRKDGKNVDNEKQIFIGQEKVLLACAINFLAHQINAEIKKQKVNLKVMNEFPLPKAFSCSTRYDDITCRLLHYGKENGTLSLLDLADKFFLLEYIAISEYYKEDASAVFSLLREAVDASK